VVAGMEQYLSCNHVLFKEYLDHVKGVSQKVKQASVRAFEEQGLPVRFLRDPSADKEEIARAIASARKLESGLVCALSSMEISPSFEHRGTHMVRRVKPCQVISQYQIRPNRTVSRAAASTSPVLSENSASVPVPRSTTACGG